MEDIDSTVVTSYVASYVVLDYKFVGFKHNYVLWH